MRPLTSHFAPPVGATPLLEIRDLPSQPRGSVILAKLESANPGGSIKDRPVQHMLRRAIAEGHLQNGRRLLDSSSGNAGIAYAQFGAFLGVPVTLVIPGNASEERLDRIRAHGAELILSDPFEGYDHAIREARRLALESPDRFWYSNQYSNESNWRAHYESTAVEILGQSHQAPEAFVAGVGTGGTITGVGRRLRETSPDVLLAGVTPEDFPGIEGLKPLTQPKDFVPEILDQSLLDTQLVVSSEEALAMCRRLARRGLYVGPSSGANLVASLRLARQQGLAIVATVLPDGGDRYGSTGMWR